MEEVNCALGFGGESVERGASAVQILRDSMLLISRRKYHPQRSQILVVDRSNTRCPFRQSPKLRKAELRIEEITHEFMARDFGRNKSNPQNIRIVDSSRKLSSPNRHLANQVETVSCVKKEITIP